MPEYEVSQFFSNAPDRDSVRMRVVGKLSQEVCGKGRGELASRYTYYVETLADGRRVYLRRPAYLHVGFDFVVCVENTNFNVEGKRRNSPSHDDILSDLRIKKTLFPSQYSHLYSLIEKVYLCENVNFSIANNIGITEGIPCDMILAVLKWLFIEQDIRYWSYSGREMLWHGIKEI